MKKVLNSIGFLILSLLAYSPLGWAQIASTNIIQGNISVPGERDVFTFSLTSNGRYYFDALSNINVLNWSLDSATGPLVSSRAFTTSDGFSTSTPVISLRPGFYRLTIDCDNEATNAYAFRFMDLASASLITPGTVVSNSLAPGNETDLYQFTSAAGDRLFFDRIFLTASQSVYWRLIDPYGNEVFGGSFNDVNTITQRVAGTYTLLIEGNLQQTTPGVYSFNVVPQGNTPPVAFAGAPLTLGEVYSGSLTNPSTNAYIFTLATDARLVFDNLTNTPGLQWFLEGPPGLIINGRGVNSSDNTGVSPTPIFDLPAGDYQLRIRRASAGSDSYRFRLLDTATATPITPGTPVSTTLTPPQEIDMYQFNASAGSRYYFDFSSTNGTSSTFWYLVDPFGSIVESTYITQDRPARTLPLSGTYTLLIEGYFGDDNGNPAYRFNIIPVTDGAQTLTLGSLTSGNIAMPGQAQRYFFTLTGNSSLYFDSRTNNLDLRWSLSGPIGTILNNRAFTSSDGPNGYSVMDLAAGDYTLTVTAVNDATPAFQFRLIDLATAASMSPGTPITSTLNPGNETDVYRFAATAGQKVYFDSINLSGIPNVFWRCVDPYGNLILSTYVGDVGPMLLPASGTYTLLVEGYHSDIASGAYTVNVVPVTDGVQPIALGDLITGAITTPGQFQIYNLSLPSPAMVYFDSQTNQTAIRWSLDGPRGNLVNNKTFNSSDATAGSAVLNLPAGNYTIKVSASGDTTGGFRFRLIDLGQAPPLTPGVPVSSTLNPANETDAYRFSAAAGSKVYFDFISSSSLPNAFWRCIDPYGAVAMSGFLGNAGPIVLQTGGIYTLLIEGYNSEPGSGSYSVNVVPVADATHELTLGTLVSDSVAMPGQAHTYHFSLGASAVLYFDSRANNSALRWSLDGPSGREVNIRQFTGSDAANIGDPLLRLNPGQYTLTVSGATDNTGPFAFRLFDISTATPYTPANQVSATLNPGNKTDPYRFTAAAGDRFFFDWVSQTGLPNLYWRLYDPYLNRIFQGLTADAGTNRLVAAGTYTLFIEGSYQDAAASGFYQFNVVPVGNVPVVPPTGTPLTIGATISSNLPTATTTNIFVFSLPTDTRLFFDSLANANCNWSLSGPSGNLIANRSFTASDALDQLDSSVNCPAGDYRLAITGAAGAYSFRLLDPAGAAPITPGTLVNDSLTPGRATALYQFSANAGDRFYYDGRSRSGFVTVVSAKIIAPFGDRLLNTSVENDADVFSVPHTGTYILSVEGRYNETAASGNFSFLLQPVTDATNTFVVGDTVSGSIAMAGQRQFHSFTLAAPARLFFDSLSYNGLTWTLAGSQGIIVNDRRFDSSDGIDGISFLDLPPGDYLITVGGSGAATNNYSFRLLDSSSAAAITPGILVSGSLAPANTTTLYRFNALAGQQFYFDGRPTTGFNSLTQIRIYSPLDDSILSQSVTTDADVFTVPQNGTYLITIEGRASETNTSGNFSFLLQPVLDGTNNINIGAAVSGSISVPGQRQFHLFSLASPTRLFFDALSYNAFTWSLSGPQGFVVNARRFDNSDSADGNPLLDLAAGDYVIMVDISAATTGSYSFRLLDAAIASSFTPGTLVSGTLTPGLSTALYRFNASAGDAFYFDGRPVTGFTTTPYVQIYSPLGNTVMPSQQITQNKDTFTVPETGTYLFSVEGRGFDTSASGNYSFLLVPNPPQPPTPLFDTNVAPDLVVVGLAVNPPSGLQSGDSATVQWTTRNDGNATTTGSFTERVTVRNTATSQVIANRTLLYDEAVSGAINSGETRARSLAVTLPNGPSGAGTLEVTVTTDALNQIAEQNAGGTAEANNATTISISSTLAPYPDLQVSTLSVSPASGWPTGSLVTVSWVTTNTGTRATSGSWTENLLVRNTNTSQIILNTATNYDANVAGDISPAGARARSLSFVMPINANAYGTFQLVVTTDNDNNLFEYNGAASAETNNSASLLSTSASDLQVTGLTVTGNPSLQAGSQLVIQWNVANQGNVQADTVFYDRITVRNTNTAELLFTTDSPYNPAANGNGPILPNGSRARQQTFQLPDGARSVGRLEVSVTTDIYQQIPETNEGNNGSQTQVTVTARPYPDLVVTTLSGPASGRPGQTLPVVWTIQNIGSVSATGSWSDHLFLSTDTAIGADQFLTSIAFNGTLNAGQSLTRTQQVTLPNFGTGNRYFVAETDAGGQLFEDNESNNATIATQPTVLPATLILTLSPSTVLESAGTHASIATLVRNSDVASALNVTLVNDRPSKIIVPSSITIPIGASSTNFFIGVINDSIADSNVVATLVAQAPAHISGTNTLTVAEDDSPALTLRLSASSVSESAFAGAVTGTVRRNAGTNQPLTVNLTSDRPSALTVPPSVTIPAGETNVTFQLSPVGDDIVTGDRLVQILAAASGFASVSAPITVLDDDTVSLSLQLSDNSVAENAINPAATAVVTRSPVNSGALRIRIQAINGSVLQLPAEVTIPANQSAVSFNVNIHDDNLAFGSHATTINVEAIAQDGTAIPGAHASAPFMVVDNDGPTLSVSISAAVIAEGASTGASVTRNTPPTNSLAVTLSAAPAGQITLPASVVIPNGAASVNFTITGVSDGVSDGAQEVDVNASATGFNPGSAPVTVTDIDVPDLVMLSVTAPTNALTDGLISAVWSVTNSGLATANGTWVDEVYVATDAQGSAATLVASVTNTGPLVVGDSYSHSRSLLLPSDPATYWILVRTDARNNLTEGSERNNALLSAPIDVQPSYRATVSTDVDAAISGTPIPLSGRTFFSATGLPAPFRTATVRINVNRVRRILDVLSDSQGNFTTVFQPIPGEAGVYTVGADHPRVRQDLVQDQFTLLGMSAVPWELNIRLAPNVSTNGQIEIRNLSPLPLTGLIADQESLPLDFTATTTVTNVLAGSASVLLNYSISTTLNTPFSGRFFLRVTSGEGAVLRIPVNFIVAPPTAQLAANPALLDRGMLRGTQTLVSFDVINQGGVASGDLAVALPVVPWLSLISTSPIPSLVPGARSTVVLALNPATNLPLVRYDGSIAIIGQQTSLGVPFQFRALSDARGDLAINVTDEHTYYVNGAPHPTNATVVLRDIVTNGIVAQAVTDAGGQIHFNNLLEADYSLEAVAPGHGSVHGTVHVVPGTTTEQEVFMTLQTVRYEWHVVPTQFEDHYRIVIEPQFETEVPQPELVVENPLIVPLVLEGQTSQFEIRLRNPGLIALERVRVPVPSHPSLIITPLVTELEVLPAQSSVTIPVTIRGASGSGGGMAGDGSGGGVASSGAPCDNCVVQIPIDTRFRCGQNFVTKTATVTVAPVCLANTGCQFDHVDVTRADFMTVNQLADRAEWECLLGHMNECQKARARGYIASGEFGSLSNPQVGFGLSDFCACGPPEKIPALLAAADAYLSALGFTGTTTPSAPSFSFVAATIPGPCNAPAAAASPLATLSPIGGGGLAASALAVSGATGVCAKVRIDLSQDVMLTRNAFRGTLVIENVGQGDITGIQVTIDIRDAANQSTNSLFGVRAPTLAGLSAVDGSGVVAAGGTGSAEYLFIPSLDAAPLQPTVYTIGGTLRFIEDGQEVVVPLLRAPITVLPEARLQLEYFQQRDVFSDDPFTPELEPAEPFALALRVNNVGAGMARSFRISSAQPRITENEKGLVVDFHLIGARINDQPVTSTFNLDLGNVNPGSSKIVVWDMTSSLQGKFIDYRASFEHVDDLGVRNSSLIESVNIHELIHVVRAERASDDTLPDFLVNDSPDPSSLPDILYLSEGGNAPVSIGSNAAITGSITPSNLQVQLTTTMPAGWTYLRMTNPGPDFRLTGVRRSDGKQIRIGDNAWTTDRTFPSSQTGVVHEKLFHLFDFNSSGNYTLTYVSVAQDTNAPSSAITALPSSSPASFPVEWSGDDGTGSGIAFFDIYVSVNGGPFTNWLAHTTLHSAIFAGQNGNTYAFYSRATDAIGNQEIAPASADTQTTTSGANTPPTMNPIANATINEGAAFNVLATALDTDTPRQTLTFSLIAAPVGATMDGASGQIRWQTGEAHGGTTNTFTLVVADNGLPSLSSTQSFSVIVREVNSAPFFVNIVPDVQVDEETTFTYTVEASDSDIPPNQLTWSLGSGAPVGMSINTANGTLTWLPGESRGPGEYPITVTVRDNGSPQMSATRSLRVIVREVNRAPNLDPIVTQVTLVETTLTVPTTASDPDIPAQQFFFSLAPGAPRGARIDSATGVFTWTPSRAFAMTTNRVTVQVTDNGVPSLTATQAFLIIVGDLLEARLGTAIVLSGGSNAVPITIYTTTPATNVIFDIEVQGGASVPASRLANFSLDPPAPPLGSATLQLLGANRYRIQLGTLAGQRLAGEQIASHLRFTAASGLPSAFVPLDVLTVTALQTDGQPVPRALGSPGRVVYLGNEPVVELLRRQGHLDLTLYGSPAPSYTIEATPSLVPTVTWTPYWQGPSSNLFETFSVSPTNQMKYFRARRP